MLLPHTSYKRKGNRGQKLLNCFAEPASPDSAQPVILLGCDGIADWQTHNKTGCRGTIKHKGITYAQTGNELIKVQGTGITVIGSIPGGDRVTMATNGKELAIAANGMGWLVKDDDTLVSITDSEFTQYRVADVTETDGRFLWCEDGGNVFFCSELYDGLSYEGEKFDLAGKYSDNCVGIMASEMLVIIGCEETMEFWYTSGESPFPYSRAPNGVAEIGLASKYSFAKDETGTYFLASDNSVRRVPLGAIEPMRISHNGVDEAITSYATKDDAWAFTTVQEGNTFYHLVFPTEGKAWVFNTKSNLWHERGSLNKAYWNIAGHCRAGEEEIVFARDSNKIGKLDPDVYTEWGGPLLREWTYANVYGKGARSIHHELQVEIDTGWPGTHNGEVNLLLDISDDGGETFRGPKQVTLWTTGEYGYRANFHKLGSGLNRVYKCYIADDAKMVVRDTHLRADMVQLPQRGE